ncbi:endonuclease/exonuclease/phosphatase family protein [Aureimonas pseudogalii]|uniref:Endonuclease/exonuclease/phosphatase family metal-dependent hydrolase n=1 Tax=Aureimonas pseudogalii TaxID=1744844 RepID=A0A7W6MKT2_9HYPH|nr:endonuclease/exonuclease/phosphatase family protein [Aureimonas pseudogalii]MBB3999192.1 endonuclease/exonuclease/phosphatase family metal-dependent hydrolase [Aureimonas pseudogalii]
MLRIVYANLGYSREIDGSIGHHVRRGHRHVFTSKRVQLRSLAAVRERLRALRPDLSCFVEIDRGSLTNGFFDQLPALQEDHHTTVRIDNKYGADKRFGRLSVSVGKSNAFLATRPLDCTARYLSAGKKRLVYDIEMSGVRVLVAHLSLRYRIRCIQIAELATWVGERETPTVVVGDFNLFRGARELEPLLRDGRLVHANAQAGPTFRLGPYRATLDTCLLSPILRERAEVEIIDQPFSDHQMIKVDLLGIEAVDRLDEPVLVATPAAA